MNSLYAYGCSFTHGYRDEIDKGWVSRLELDTSYKLINKGHAGAGWVTVRNKLLEDITKFKPQDIVIVQIPFLYRVEIPYFEEKYDSFMRLWNEHPEGTVEWLKYTKPEHQLEAVTAYEAMTLFNLIRYLGIHLMWWSSDAMPTLKNSDYIQLSIEGHDSFFSWSHSRYDLTIGGDASDTHLNSDGYDFLAKEFSRQINNVVINPLTRLI